MKTVDRTDAAAGILFLLFALYFGLQSLGLELGTAFRMGPGYFPLVLSCVLAGFGLLVLFNAFKSGSATDAGTLAWRGMLFILPAPVFFGLTVRGLGFVPAIFLTTLIAGLASLKMRLHWALLLAVGVTLFSTLVFSYALGLPFRRFGPWLSF
ncbi:tripartite tricarboxylate transporter TctB family protein [Rhodobacter amnigenus]|nr:tripartite tricarboxylate transporter TctB family protein [Rhodobacter amnigenus]